LEEKYKREKEFYENDVLVLNNELEEIRT